MTEVEKLQAELAAKNKRIAELETKRDTNGNGSGEFAKLERELSDALISGPKHLASLPAHLQDRKFLLYMTRTGQVEFGRAPHYFNHSDQLMPSDGEISWANCQGRGSKSVIDLLDEEKNLEAANKLKRQALLPKDFGGELEKGKEHKKVDVDIRLQVRLATRA